MANTSLVDPNNISIVGTAKGNCSIHGNATCGNVSDPYEEYLTAVRMSVNTWNAGILVVVCPFVLFGNLLVVVSVYRYRHLRTAMNMFVLSLSFSDILVAVPTIPLYIAFYVRGDVLSGYKYVCLLKYAAVIASLSGSIISLTFLTFDRYVAVIHPLYYHVWMTKHRAKRIIAGIWTYDVIASTLPLLGYNKWTPGAKCDFFAVLPKPYTIVTTPCVTAVCLTASVFMYTRIFIATKRHRKRVAQMNVNSVQKRKSKRQMDKDTRMAKLMGFIFLLFFVFWFPFQLSSLLKYLPFSKQIFEMAKTLALTLAMTNSVVNPIVYGALRIDFRLAFRRILGFPPKSCMKMKYVSQHSTDRQHIVSGASSSEMTNNLDEPIFQIAGSTQTSM